MEVLSGVVVCLRDNGVPKKLSTCLDLMPSSIIIRILLV